MTQSMHRTARSQARECQNPRYRNENERTFRNDTVHRLNSRDSYIPLESILATDASSVSEFAMGTVSRIAYDIKYGTMRGTSTSTGSRKFVVLYALAVTAIFVVLGPAV